MATMKAVVLREPHKIEVMEVPKPEITDPGDVLMRVDLTALCGTDLHPYEGRIVIDDDVVLGHEFLGTIEAVGSGVNLVSEGDRAAEGSAIRPGYRAAVIAASTGS